MITPSPELCAVVRRTQNAIRTMDRDILQSMFSSSDALRFVGTGANEIWEADVLRTGVIDHFGELPAHNFYEDAIDAFEDGTIGWVFWRGVLVFEDGDKEVRANYLITYILTLEQGAWKIVHMHTSNPDSNYEKLGIENVALAALMAAAQEGPLDVGHAGMANIMFTDVVDSSALADLIGDKNWINRVDSHFQRITEIVEKAGGTLVKSLGDGTMSTFPSTRAALSAAKTIQSTAINDTSEPAMRLRVGLHTGEVIENKGDFFGTVVNKAARITAATVPDEIRVSDATRIMLGRAEGFEFDDPQEIEIKGLPGLHRVYRLHS